MGEGRRLSVVLGASGGTGSAIVRALHEGGHRVRAVGHRFQADVPPDVERSSADLMSADGAHRAVEGAAVVYHAAQPRYTRWVEEFPRLNRAVIEAVAGVQAKLVFCDNLYMYEPGPAGVMTEESPLRPTGKKSRLRARMAAEILAAHRGGIVRATIGRSSDYVGENGRNSALGERLFRAVLAGRRARWLGSLDVPHTVSYLGDMARAYVTLGESASSDGQIWHLPAAPPVTGRAFLEMAFRAAGKAPKLASTSPTTVRLAGLFVPLIRELGDVMYQWTAPFVSEWSKFREAFGPFEPTSLEEAVRSTCAWFAEHPSK